MPWYIMSTTICFECLPDLGEMASNQTIQHTKLLNLLENRWISPYLPLIWWIPPSSATSTTTCFMDPPDMSEIAPDPTILDLTEAPPRLGGASDRGTTEAGRRGLFDQATTQNGGRHRPSDFHVAHDQLEHCPQPGGAHQGEVEELRADRGVEREHAEA